MVFVLEADAVVSRAGLCVILCLSQFQSLCQELESSFYDGMFPWQQLKQHDAASLLKLFIRELPHPLLTVEYLNAFIAVNSTWAAGFMMYSVEMQNFYRYATNKVKTFLCLFTELPTKKQQLQALNLLVLLLPEANRDTLKVDSHSVYFCNSVSTSGPFTRDLEVLEEVGAYSLHGAGLN